jgi:hypothetical protein
MRKLQPNLPPANDLFWSASIHRLNGVNKASYLILASATLLPCPDASYPGNALSMTGH